MGDNILMFFDNTYLNVIKLVQFSFCYIFGSFQYQNLIRLKPEFINLIM